jgi:hypothetical protein
MLSRRIYDRASVQVSTLKHLPSHPTAASYALPVRRASALPAASFRFHLAMDTLPSGYQFPLPGLERTYTSELARSR